MLVLTQYKAMSLDRHINLGWRHFFCRELGEFIDVVPPQQRIDEHWYQGTADAVYQNIYSLEKQNPDYVVILAGDHIYKMDYANMVRHHQESKADLTIGALRVTQDEARAFGVMQVDNENRICGFAEKPDNPECIPGEPGQCLASMGIYVFTARFLFEQLCQDATRISSTHDFGRDLIPSIINSHRVCAFPFRDENQDANEQQAYWRDVGTVDAYYEANMDLVSVEPQLNMYDEVWPIRTFNRNLPPPKFVFRRNEAEDRSGVATDSIVCQGTIVSGGEVERSILGRNVRVNSYSKVEGSILFDGVNIGRHAKIRNAIIDKRVDVPAGAVIGYDSEHDRQRGFTVTESGVVVIASGIGIESPSQLEHA